MSEENSTETFGTGNAGEIRTDWNEPELIRLSADTLPKDTVHCYPAKKSLIVRRRLISGISGTAFLASLVFFLLPDSLSIVSAVISTIGFIICLLVFLQSFLITGFRVAIDYGKQEVVLRYQFQKIRIPFEDFDTREGKQDDTEAQLSRVFLRATKVASKYLILDNVRESACYQTTSKDLASPEDFDQLKADVENIRNVFRGKPSEPLEPVLEEDEMTRIINSALADKPKNIDE